LYVVASKLCILTFLVALNFETRLHSRCPLQVQPWSTTNLTPHLWSPLMQMCQELTFHVYTLNCNTFLKVFQLLQTLMG
jgi:hypothetical protein